MGMPKGRSYRREGTGEIQPRIQTKTRVPRTKKGRVGKKRGGKVLEFGREGEKGSQIVKHQDLETWKFRIRGVKF